MKDNPFLVRLVIQMQNLIDIFIFSSIGKRRIRLTRLFATLAVKKLRFFQKITILGFCMFLRPSILVFDSVLNHTLLLTKSTRNGFLDLLRFQWRFAVASISASWFSDGFEITDFPGLWYWTTVIIMNWDVSIWKYLWIEVHIWYWFFVLMSLNWHLTWFLLKGR